MFDRILQKLKLVGKKGLDILFKPADTPLAKWLVAILLGVLFIVGLLHWGYFLNWFNNQFNIGDWHIIDGPILIFLAKAFRSGQLPMHAVSPLIVPDRYLGRPDRSLSPQILLLYFLDPATYVVVNVWIFYTIGFIALLLIRRRYRLSPASFLLLYLLFNFNGDVTAHLAVGHMDWVGYFLLPFFVLLVLKMLEGEKTGWVWVFIVALTMLAINFQGSVHIFLYCMAFLLFLAVFQPRYWAPALKAIIASSLISMMLSSCRSPSNITAVAESRSFMDSYRWNTWLSPLSFCIPLIYWIPPPASLADGRLITILDCWVLPSWLTLE